MQSEVFSTDPETVMGGMSMLAPHKASILIPINKYHSPSLPFPSFPVICLQSYPAEKSGQ